MEEIDLNGGVEIALDALHADRLALLCGAGLSMASPSSLPSAAHIADKAKRKYDSIYGSTRPPLPASIEEQAEFFFKRGELATIYLRTLVDPNTFAGRPNAGHNAIADLLLVRGIQTAVSTNVDTMIETAGKILLGEIGVGIDRPGVAAIQADRSPLLKIHGCWSSDQDTTLWAPGQILVEPFVSRISGSKQWLSNRLLDRDLLIIGYWTDWDYLNAMLDETLGEVRLCRVIVVDPNDAASLVAKAPILHSLSQAGRTRTFYHVRQSGAEFLDRLRMMFSQSFVRRVLHTGVETYEQQSGTIADLTWKEPPASLTVDDLWQVRRDLEGRLPTEPAREHAPPEEPLLGLTIVQLRARGAVADGSHWLLDEHRVRVIRTPNQLLHQVQVNFARETPPVVGPDLIVAVGAEDHALPANIVRGGTAPTIARGSVGRWLTRQDAVTELGL